ncbi:TadA family conjugal transfer-associated ATPase [Paenarthrobacter sp. 4246]|uniref:TadA family conjugal transfer-associated ATPase n=1 Tax=Paenarthrobacter sp. 4246 TaxID=3156456 RepID=UPI0033983D0B
MNPFEGTRRRQGRKLDSLLLETVRESVLAGNGPVTPSTVAAAVQASGRLLGTAGALEAAESINAELNGLGPLQQLAQNPAVTDIFVNGPNSVWLDRGQGLERSSVHFDTEQQIRSLASRLVSAGGRRLDDGSPCVDVRLNGGYRVHAVLSPISTTGTLLSIRIRRENVFTLPELRESGMFSEQCEWVLRAIMSQRLSFLISGATGSGKTTLLSTLLGLCHPTERLVLIEDAAELNPVHPHVVTLESRHGNLEGGGALDLGELVRQALRMRPDRLIVGECRGAEVRELLTALNTGHTGGGGTIHANAAEAVPARLVALGALAGLNAEAVRLQVSSALDVVIHVDRTPTGRKVASIGVLTDTSEGQKVVSALHWHPTGMTCGPAWPALARRLRPSLPTGFDGPGFGGAPGRSAETLPVDGMSASTLPGTLPDALPDGSWATLNGSPSPWPIP